MHKILEARWHLMKKNGMKRFNRRRQTAPRKGTNGTRRSVHHATNRRDVADLKSSTPYSTFQGQRLTVPKSKQRDETGSRVVRPSPRKWQVFFSGDVKHGGKRRLDAAPSAPERITPATQVTGGSNPILTISQGPTRFRPSPRGAHGTLRLNNQSCAT